VSADHSVVDCDYAVGMDGADSHFVVDSGNDEVAGSGSTD